MFLYLVNAETILGHGHLNILSPNSDLRKKMKGLINTPSRILNTFYMQFHLNKSNEESLVTNKLTVSS